MTYPHYAVTVHSHGFTETEELETAANELTDHTIEDAKNAVDAWLLANGYADSRGYHNVDYTVTEFIL